MRNIIIIASNSQGIRFVFRAAKRIRDRFPSRVKRFFPLEETPPGEANCCRYLKGATNSVTIFFAHGDKEVICGWHKRTLVKYPDNYKILNGLSVVAFACKSADILGKKAVEDRIVKVFFGFDDDISWEGCKRTYKGYIREKFEQTISDAIKKRKSFERFQKALYDNLLRDLKNKFSQHKVTYEMGFSLVSAIYCAGNLQETF